MIVRLRDHADPLNARDIGQRLLPEVGRPAGAEQVQRSDGRGPHLDQGLAGLRYGPRPLTQLGRRRVRVEQSGAHDQVAMSG